MITAAERQEAIRHLLAERRHVSVSDLAKGLSVSEMTVRRDLAALEKEGRLVRTFGGGVATAKAAFEFEFDARQHLHMEAKEAIGRLAASLVKSGDTVLLDTGTTTLQMARAMKGQHGVTVLTCSLAIASELYAIEGIELVLLGGHVRKRSPDIYGPLTEHNVARMRPDKAFLGADGISVEQGLSTRDFGVARVGEVMIESAGETIVVADSSKIGRVGLVTYAPVSKIDILITDAGIEAAQREAFERAGVRVMLAEPGPVERRQA